MVTSQIPYQKNVASGKLFLFQPLKKLWSHHKFPTKKCCFREIVSISALSKIMGVVTNSLPKKRCFRRKCVCFFFLIGVFVCCYLFQTWVISQWWTLKPNQTPFFGGKPDFFVCFSSMVFSSKRQAYATIGPCGSLLQKRFRLSGRRPWGPAVLDWSIRESCRFPKPMVGPMGGGGVVIWVRCIHVTVVGVIIWHRPKQCTAYKGRFLKNHERFALFESPLNG